MLENMDKKRGLDKKKKKKVWGGGSKTLLNTWTFSLAKEIYQGSSLRGMI